MHKIYNKISTSTNWGQLEPVFQNQLSRFDVVFEKYGRRHTHAIIGTYSMNKNIASECKNVCARSIIIARTYTHTHARADEYYFNFCGRKTAEFHRNSGTIFIVCYFTNCKKCRVEPPARPKFPDDS